MVNSPLSTLENAKIRLQGYSFSEELLAIGISDNTEKCIVTIVAYILPSMSEEEKEELDCYFTEVIAGASHFRENMVSGVRIKGSH